MSCHKSILTSGTSWYHRPPTANLPHVLSRFESKLTSKTIINGVQGIGKGEILQGSSGHLPPSNYYRLRGCSAGWLQVVSASLLPSGWPASRRRRRIPGTAPTTAWRIFVPAALWLYAAWRRGRYSVGTSWQGTGPNWDFKFKQPQPQPQPQQCHTRE